MASVQRLKRGDGMPLRMKFPASIEIEAGDLIFADPVTGYAKPANLWTWEYGPTETKWHFAVQFAGVAADAHRADDDQDRDGNVWSEGVYEFPCESTTYQVGDYFGPADDLANEKLHDQLLEKVVDVKAAIGFAVEYTDTAKTMVKIRLLSRIASYGAIIAHGLYGTQAD